jgi:hypothetical protein
MSTFLATLDAIRAGSSRLLRGTLLVIWIIVLTGVALGSLEGTLADLLLSGELWGGSSRSFGIARYSEFIDRPQSTPRCLTGDELLTRHRLFEENSPPIGALLDALAPTWPTAKMTGECSKEIQEKIGQIYRNLFAKAADRLRSVAQNDNIDLKILFVDILPPDFQNLAAPTNQEFRIPI